MRYIKFFFAIIVLLLFYNPTKSQDYFVGGGLNLNTYFGDLSPIDLKQSPASFHPGVGLYFSKRIFKLFYVEVDLEHNTISGNDAKSKDEPRRIRNLSFKSPITSLAFSGGIRLLITKKFGISGGLGGAIFKFDPKAKLDNSWYRLHPLSTEGQGLVNGPKPYSLTQFAIPIHTGIFIKTSDRFAVELVITQYFTETDYLDDLSGYYYDLDLLRSQKGDLAARLAYRTPEIISNALPIDNGAVRGNPAKNDQFLYMKIGVSWIIDTKSNRFVTNKKVKCPKIN